MKGNEFEALALLRRWVKEMRASGEMDAQHDAGAATQPQEQIDEESPDFKLAQLMETQAPNLATAEIIVVGSRVHLT